MELEFDCVYNIRSFEDLLYILETNKFINVDEEYKEELLVFRQYYNKDFCIKIYGSTNEEKCLEYFCVEHYGRLGEVIIEYKRNDTLVVELL